MISQYSIVNCDSALRRHYEPLLGHIVLEQCQASVDMLGLRLVHVKKTDLKWVKVRRARCGIMAEEAW